MNIIQLFLSVQPHSFHPFHFFHPINVVILVHRLWIVSIGRALFPLKVPQIVDIYRGHLQLKWGNGGIYSTKSPRAEPMSLLLSYRLLPIILSSSMCANFLGRDMINFRCWRCLEWWSPHYSWRVTENLNAKHLDLTITMKLDLPSFKIEKYIWNKVHVYILSCKCIRLKQILFLAMIILMECRAIVEWCPTNGSGATITPKA